MPAIVAYSGPPSTNPDPVAKAAEELKMLLAGMQFLGLQFLSTTGKKGANTDSKKAKGVRDALLEVIKKTGHELRFQNVGNSNSGKRGFKIIDVTSSGSSVECKLTDQNGNSMGTLILEIKRDTESDSNPKPEDDEYYMRISFPEKKDDTGADYLEAVAEHVEAIIHSGSTTPFVNASHYLAAFKFLSRCK